MPGITGIISKMPREKNEKALKLMVECMAHESFYNTGTYINEQIGLYTGWICHKGSFSDCMPIFNEKKDLVLIFFGENFADKDLFLQLKRKHHIFDSSNASYLIHLYEELGDDFLEELNGWFSGILLDIQKGKVILFNDRYGMQRIYYYEGMDAFYFSSEAKSLLKVCPQLKEINMKSLGEFFCCNCVLEYRTLFNNVFLLPGAAAWTFTNGRLVKKYNYFMPDVWENQPMLEKEFFYNKLKNTFLKILPRYFQSEQQIGISLTGGLDTRMIMACINTPPGKYPCYTFGSIYRDCNDVKIARKVSDACQQTHQVISLDRKFLSDFPKYAEKTIYISDGYLDVSGSPEVYVNSLAREIAPIRMTGNHGSELFRNVRWLKAIYPCEKLFHPDFKKLLKNAISTYDNISSGHPLSFTLFKEAPWHEYNRLAVEQSQLTLRTPYMDKDLAALMYRSPPEVRNTKETSLRIIADGRPALREIITDRGVGGKLKPPLSIFPRWYHESFFKAEYIYNYGMPQWLACLDYILKAMHIERLFLGRHKFYHFRVWYRDTLADYVREILLDERTLNRQYLNKPFIEEMVNSHTKGYRNYTTEITKMLTIELIQRLLIEDI